MLQNSTVRSYIMVSFILMLCTTLGYTQDEWTLQKCIQHAQDNNLTIKQSEIAIQQSNLTLEQSKKARYPSLSGSLSLGYNAGRFIDPTTNAFVVNDVSTNSYGLSANAMIYNGGSISKTIEKNKIDLSATKKDLDQSKLDIALNVANAYLNILLAIEQKKNAEIALVQTKNQLDQTNKLIAAGSLPEGDKYNLEAQIARDEQSLVASQNSVDLSYLNLKTLLQLELSAAFKIEQPNIAVPSPESLELISLESIYKQSEAFQPNIQAGELRKQSAQLGVELAKAGMRPTVSAFSNVGTNYSTFTDTEYFSQLNQNLNGSLGLSLSVPIYDKGQTKTGVEQARLSVLQQNISNQQLNQTLKADIQRAYADALAAAKQFQAARRTVNANEKAFENTSKRYKAGVSNSFEFATSQDNLSASRFSLSIAKYDYLFKIKILDYYQGKKISIQ